MGREGPGGTRVHDSSTPTPAGTYLPGRTTAPTRAAIARKRAARPTEPTEPAEPTDSTDPAEPIDRTEPAEPIDSAEPAEAIDQAEPAEAIERWLHTDHQDADEA